MKKIFLILLICSMAQAAEQVNIIDGAGQQVNPGANNRWPVMHLNAAAGVTELLAAPGTTKSHFVTGFIMTGGAATKGFHFVRNSCLQFGSSDTWTVTDGAAIQFDAGDFSLGVWTLNALATPTQAGLLSKDDGDDGYILSVTSAGLANFVFGDGSADVTITGSTDLTASEGWHYIVVTCDRDSATGLNLYVDGVLDATAVDGSGSTGQCDGTSTNLVSTGTANGNIYISRVEIYKGAILSAATILANYNAGVGSKLVGTEDDLSAGWNNDEGSGAAAYDVLNTNNAALSTTAWAPYKAVAAAAEVNVMGAPFDDVDMMSSVGKFHCGLGTNYGGVFINFPHPVMIGRNNPLSVLETDGAFDLIVFGYTSKI